MRHLKITRYHLVIFLVIFMFSPLSVNAAEEAQPELQRASVRLYTNGSDGKTWVHIYKPDIYESLIVDLPDGNGAHIFIFNPFRKFVSPPLTNFLTENEFDFPIEQLTGRIFRDARRESGEKPEKYLSKRAPIDLNFPEGNGMNLLPSPITRRIERVVTLRLIPKKYVMLFQSPGSLPREKDIIVPQCI